MAPDRASVSVDEGQTGKYLSFVVAARNDNYGVDFLYRLQVFIDRLLSLSMKYDLDSEIVIVEWNPPPENSKLMEALTWPENMKPGMVRIVEVPAEAHNRLPNSDRIPMFEYVAKNVGIRRSSGEYVLSTNPDILFSEQLIEFLSLKQLNDQNFYRVNRYDIGKKLPPGISIEEQVRFAQKNLIAISYTKYAASMGLHSLKRAYFALASKYRRAFKTKLLDEVLDVYGLSIINSGDFFLMAKKHWEALLGYPEFQSHSHIDSYMCVIAYSHGLRQVVLKGKKRIYHQYHVRSDASTRPFTDYEVFSERSKRMLESGVPILFNDESWGLGDQDLPEVKIS